jgi:hypothetical protein
MQEVEQGLVELGRVRGGDAVRAVLDDDECAAGDGFGDALAAHLERDDGVRVSVPLICRACKARSAKEGKSLFVETLRVGCQRVAVLDARAGYG